MIYFTAHTFIYVCHCRRALFRVLGMYNFGLGQKYKNIFVGFLVQMKSLEFAFEINWPLLQNQMLKCSTSALKDCFEN